MILFLVLSYRQKIPYLKNTVTFIVLLTIFSSTSLKIFQQNSIFQYDKDWLNFFTEVSTPRAVHMIRSGKLSPWLLYNSKGGIKLMESLTQEQMIMIEEYVSPNSWSKRFQDSPDDVKFVLQITKAAGI